jgi:hypothetical protein
MVLFVNVRPKYLTDVTDSSVCPWSWYLASIIFFLLVTLSTVHLSGWKVIDGSTSDAVSVDSWVPQGSALGTGLFFYYINDLQSRITSTVRLFADDTICKNNVDIIGTYQILIYFIISISQGPECESLEIAHIGDKVVSKSQRCLLEPKM